VLDSYASIRLGAGIFAFKRLGPWETLALVTGLGVFGVLNQFAKSLACRNVRNPANLGPFLYGSLVAAAFFDWILYGQVPPAETLLGGMFILASALTVALGTLKRHEISNHPIS
jgi:drug/metabolite transporter (DMT)-like permease